MDEVLPNSKGAQFGKKCEHFNNEGCKILAPEIKEGGGGGYGCHDPANKKKEKQEASENAGPDITAFCLTFPCPLKGANVKVRLPNITAANGKKIQQIKQFYLFLVNLYMKGGLWVLPKETPCLAQELIMTVCPGLVASQVVFDSEHENMQKCPVMQELAKKMGTSIKNLKKDLGYMGIATRYCSKTGKRIFAFLLDQWNTQCTRIGKNGTQGGPVKELPIDRLIDLPKEFAGTYKIYRDLLNKAEQDQHANEGKQEESREAGAGARQQPLAMEPSSSTKSDVSATGKVEATEMPSVSAPAAVTSSRKRALKQELLSGEQESRRTKARFSGGDQTFGGEAGSNKAGAPVSLVMPLAILQVKPDAEEWPMTMGAFFGRGHDHAADDWTSLVPDANPLEPEWFRSLARSAAGELQEWFESLESSNAGAPVGLVMTPAMP